MVITRTTVLKCILLVCNSAYAILGIVLVGLGAVSLRNVNTLSFVDTGIYVAYIVVGCWICILSLFGSVPVIKESYWMVVAYSAILFLHLTVETIVMIISLGIKIILLTKIESYIKDVWEKYFGDSRQMNGIQEIFSCCGLNGPQDYDKDIPLSCCPMGNECGEDYYKIGCIKAIPDFFERITNISIYIGLVDFVLELVNFVLSYFLGIEIKKNQRPPLLPEADRTSRTTLSTLLPGVPLPDLPLPPLPIPLPSLPVPITSLAKSLPSLPVSLPSLAKSLPSLPVSLPSLPIPVEPLRLNNLQSNNSKTDGRPEEQEAPAMDPEAGRTTRTGAAPPLGTLLPGVPLPDLPLPSLPVPLPSLAKSLPSLAKSLPSLPKSLPSLAKSLPSLEKSLPLLPESLPSLPVTLPSLPVSLPSLPMSLPIPVKSLKNLQTKKSDIDSKPEEQEAPAMDPEAGRTTRTGTLLQSLPVPLPSFPVSSTTTLSSAASLEEWNSEEERDSETPDRS